MTTVDGQRFRAVMAAVCAPVTVVTTTGADGPAGCDRRLVHVAVARPAAGRREPARPGRAAGARDGVSGVLATTAETTKVDGGGA